MGKLNVHLTRFIFLSTLIFSSYVARAHSIVSFAACPAAAECPDRIRRWISSVQSELPDIDFNNIGSREEMSQVRMNLFSDKFFMPIFTKTVFEFTDKEVKQLAKEVKKCGTEVIPEALQEELQGSFKLTAEKYTKDYLNSAWMCVSAEQINGSREWIMEQQIEAPQSFGYLLHMRLIALKGTGDFIWLLPTEAEYVIKRSNEHLQERLEQERARFREIEALAKNKGIVKGRDAWKANDLRISKEYKRFTKQQHFQFFKTLYEENSDSYDVVCRLSSDYELTYYKRRVGNANLSEIETAHNLLISLKETYINRRKYLTNNPDNPYFKKYFETFDSIFFDAIKKVKVQQQHRVDQMTNSGQFISALKQVRTIRKKLDGASYYVSDLDGLYTGIKSAIVRRAAEQEEHHIGELLKAEKPIVVLDALYRKKLEYEEATQGDSKTTYDLYYLWNFFTSSYDKIEKQIIEGNDLDELTELGSVYVYGSTNYNLPNDKEKGVRLLTTCASKDHTEAQYLLGKSYISSNASQSDLTKAAEWIYKARVAGSSKAEDVWNKHKLEKYL